ncbi:hypothetical protein J3R30DRAFT_3719487 [Lentinula aciculospora]|uniref:ABM domain-containing protein n=1 Tax=Lentinula aciculospora TaxID=153920 RepID=A0A9W8ZUY5_9AGAR|nr:hypothetical protein J3R30DRAFT_3719487 [Lentinula aciculospora]
MSSTGTKIIQYITFPANDVFINDRARFAGGLEKIATADGHISSFWGLQVPEEGAKMGYLITVWESAEHHKKFSASSLFETGMETLNQAASGELTRHQFIGLRGTPIPGFQSTTTEIVVVKPNAGVSKDTFKNAAYSLGDIFSSHGLPVALGKSVNGDDVYGVIIGWPSISESRTTVRSEPFASSIGSISSLATLELSHVNLNRHT